MNASNIGQLSGLLQFEVNSQVFAISVADLVGVRQITDLSIDDSATPPPDYRMTATPVDLSFVFFGYTNAAESRSVLIAQAGSRLCPLLVGRVLPGTVDPTLERHTMPDLLVSLGLPFSGMFFKTDQWVLILDISRLIDLAASLNPRTIVEAVYEQLG